MSKRLLNGMSHDIKSEMERFLNSGAPAGSKAKLIEEPNSNLSDEFFGVSAEKPK